MKILAKFILFQNISKIKLNKILQFPLEQGKYTTSQTLSSILHLEGRTGYFKHWHKIKPYKNEMNLKVIKSHECSLERSHAELIEINSEFWSGHSLFWTKTDPYRSTSHKSLQKQSSENFFIQLLYAWLYLTNNNFRAPTSIEELLQPTHMTGL